MAIDSSLAIRKETIKRFRSDTALTALVPAQRIYGPQVAGLPEFPFVRVGEPVTLPLRASGMDGAVAAFSAHAFALGPGEDAAAAIAAALARALDGRVLPLPAGKAVMVWTRTQILRDGAEADAWHAVVDFEARAATA